MSLNIHIKTIPNDKQRYPTVGDYWQEGDTTEYRVSEMNTDYEFLVAIHELIESYLTKRRGIEWEAIDAFDKEFETNRQTGNVEEPGNSPLAPYYKEHRFAENIERQVALALGVDWFEYDKTVNELWWMTAYKALKITHF